MAAKTGSSRQIVHDTRRVPTRGSPNREATDPTPLGLDQLIHGRLRLGIMSALAVNDSVGFGELKEMLGTTDGNLSVQARRLEDAGYLACQKSFDGRVPRTEYRLTPAGRRALEKYVAHMEALLKAVSR